MDISKVVSNSSNLFSNISLIPSWDLLAFVVLIGAAFLYGVTLGKNRLIALILSIYFSYILTNAIPWEIFISSQQTLKDFPTSTTLIFVFLAIVLAFVFLIPHSVLGAITRPGKVGRKAWLQILIFSICAVGLLASNILVFLPTKAITDLNPLIKQTFIGPTQQFFWLLVPLLVLVLLRAGKAEIV